jgi:hypothetical protein
MIERIGKNSGVWICGTPKYLHARSESNLEYAALAGSVQGGLFPVQNVSNLHVSVDKRTGMTFGYLSQH